MSIQTRMCRQSKCDQRQHCYRYRAIPVEPPRVQEYGSPKSIGASCSSHIGVYDRLDVRDMAAIEGVAK